MESRESGEWFSVRKFASKIWLRLCRETRGAELAEAAAVLPLMFMMLLGIFWFGQAFSTYGTITRAAQEGARAAVTPVCTTCAAGVIPAQNAYTAIQSVLVTSKLDPAKMQQPAPAPSLVSCDDGSAVSCDPTQGKVCVQTPVQLSSTVSGAGVCGIAVSFQYPYQFWLPFTSLNKQRILLNAQARVRLETR
jgi:Flp pilus assembly protein TadG